VLGAAGPGEADAPGSTGPGAAGEDATEVVSPDTMEAVSGVSEAGSDIAHAGKRMEVL
jgi:hypothetical protein